VGVLTDEDVQKLLVMVDPETWDATFERGGKWIKEEKSLPNNRRNENFILSCLFLFQREKMSTVRVSSQ